MNICEEIFNFNHDNNILILFINNYAQSLSIVNILNVPVATLPKKA